MRIYELRQKEVINCCTCERLGFICDVIFDPCSGCISKIVVPGPCKVWGILGHEKEYIIPFNCIKKIGTDIILVDLDAGASLVGCALEK